MKTEPRLIDVGDQVAFNRLSDAVWFDVLAIASFSLTVREAGTDYRAQVIDKSTVKQVRKKEA